MHPPGRSGEAAVGAIVRPAARSHAAGRPAPPLGAAAKVATVAPFVGRQLSLQWRTYGPRISHLAPPHTPGVSVLGVFAARSFSRVFARARRFERVGECVAEPPDAGDCGLDRKCSGRRRGPRCCCCCCGCCCRRCC